MEIVVQLRPELSAKEIDEALATIRTHGFTVNRTHPGSAETTLARYYTANIDDPIAAEKVLTALRKMNEVEAAYAKPAGDIP